MNRRIGYIILLCWPLLALVQDGNPWKPLPKHFVRGEYLKYRAYFGFFPVGHGTWKVQPNTIQIHDRPTFQVDVVGKTGGLVDLVAAVDDRWVSYVDTVSLLPHLAVRNLQEGNYRKIDFTEFFHEEGVIKYKDMNLDSGTFKPIKEYTMEDITYGMISGYLYFRSLDFSRLTVGDTVTIKAFLEDTFYDLQVICYKRDVIEVRAGTFKAIAFRPVMPENTIFEGEDAVLAWISDDQNKIPLRVEARMFIGHAGIELTEYQNLKYPPALVDE